MERAKAALAEAKAALDLAEQDGHDSRVHPPKAGTINVKSVATGQFVERGRSIAQLIDPRRLRLRFRLTETESVRVATDSPTTFRSRAHAGNDFPARIYHVSTQADALTRMVDVLAWVDNADGRLKPGFFAEVRVKVASRAGAPVVPESAVMPTERGLVAFVVEGDQARERRPVLGLHTTDGMVEVLDGLKAGERLVVRGAAALRDNAKVSIVDPAKAGKPGAEKPAAPGTKP
jgi:multidrug efflux system membrane fusion protein